MIILTIRTDKPESEIGLYDDSQQLAYVTWEAHRKLAETLHAKIAEMFKNNNLEITKIEGIIVYQGPGSFTGLRIGIAVANALAYSFGLPIVAETDEWIERGIKNLRNSKNDVITIPEYGQNPHVTTQKK